MVASRRSAPRRPIDAKIETGAVPLQLDPSMPALVHELKDLCQRFVSDNGIRRTLTEALARLERLPPEQVFLVVWMDGAAAFEHETDADLALRLLGKEVGVKNVAALHRTYRSFEIGYRKSVREGALAKLRRAGLSPEELVALGLDREPEAEDGP